MEQVFAQSLTLPDGTPLNGPVSLPGLGSTFSLGDIISSALPIVFAGAGMGLLVMLISGGFDFLTSAGEAKKMQGAQQKLTNAVIGFIIVFVAFWLVQMLGYIFGVTEFRQIFG